MEMQWEAKLQTSIVVCEMVENKLFKQIIDEALQNIFIY